MTFKNTLNTLRTELNMSDNDIASVEFGLLRIYMNFTKYAILLLVSAIFGITYDFIVIIMALGVFRSAFGGPHKEDYVNCLIVSMLTLFGGFAVANLLKLDLFLLIMLLLICLYIVYLFSPMTSDKNPILSINVYLRRKRKAVRFALIASVVFVSLFIFNVFTYSVMLVFSMYMISVFLILPVSYKVLGVTNINGGMQYVDKQTWKRDFFKQGR